MRTGFLKRAVSAGKRCATHSPSAKGTPMMSRMWPTICTGSSAMVLSRVEAVGCTPPQKAKLSGMATMAMALDTAVIDTLRATLPLARCVRMLLTLPGGQQATRIMPSAMLGPTPSSSVRPKVMAGRKRNCATTPTAKASGMRSTRLKSSMRVSSEMPNIRKASTALSTASEAGLKFRRISSMGSMRCLLAAYSNAWAASRTALR